MIDEKLLSAALQARVDEIVKSMDQELSDITRLLQSTRARVLMDVIECIAALPRATCYTAEELKRRANMRSWQGQVDRQSGAFEDWEYRNPSNWR